LLKNERMHTSSIISKPGNERQCSREFHHFKTGK